MERSYYRWCRWDGSYDSMSDQEARQCIESSELYPVEFLHFMFNPENLTFDTFSDLIDALKKNPYLQRLSIYDCDIEKTHKIAELIETSSSLKRLVFHTGDKNDEIVIRMFQALRSSSLKRLAFVTYRLTSSQIRYIMDVLQYNTSMEKLMISYSPYGLKIEDKEAIVKTLQVNSTLIDISFRSCGLRASMGRQVDEMLARNRYNKQMRESGLVWHLLKSGVLVDV